MYFSFDGPADLSKGIERHTSCDAAETAAAGQFAPARRGGWSMACHGTVIERRQQRQFCPARLPACFVCILTTCRKPGKHPPKISITFHLVNLMRNQVWRFENHKKTTCCSLLLIFRKNRVKRFHSILYRKKQKCQGKIRQRTIYMEIRRHTAHPSPLLTQRRSC